MPTELELSYRNLLEENKKLLKQRNDIWEIVRALSKELKIAEDECKALRGELSV